jgi:hypothetical protein
MKTFNRRFAALYALTALTSGLAIWAAGCGAEGGEQEEPALGTTSEASTTTGNLPGGTSIKVTIINPVNNLVVPPSPLAVNGTAEIGLGVPVANTLLVYTLDVSGSTLASGGCGGDKNGDGASNTVLDCEIHALSTLNGIAISTGTVSKVGLAIFAQGGSATDIAAAGGSQSLASPSADANGSGGLDIDQVLASASAASGSVGLFTSVTVGADATNYGAGITAALSIAAASALPNKIVVFVSDGLSNAGPTVASVLASPPPGVVFHTFAVGSASSCTGGSTGSLQDIANLTGGTCTNVPNVASLPSIIPGVIASQLTGLKLTLDGIAVTGAVSIVPVLPQAGPGSIAFSTSLSGLSPGSHVICAKATGSDGGGSGSVEDCHTFSLSSPPNAECKDVTVAANASCSASGVSVNNGSSDPDGDALSCVQSPAGPYALGSTSVGLLCTDSNGGADSCKATIKVIDTASPAIACPSDKTLECSKGSAVATFAATASDNCGAPVVTCAPPSGSSFPLGSTAGVCTAKDGSGNASVCGFNVNVVDTLPPVVVTSGARVSYWPPNHSYQSFSLSDCVKSVTDACGGALDINAKGQITRITSDEVEDAGGDKGNNGDGKTCLDAKITSATTASLRAERQGTSDGRVYTIYFKVFDDAKNVAEASCQAQVVHDQSPANAVAIDSGCAYCTGSGCGACAGPSASCGK